MKDATKMESDELPNIILPGDEKFQSYLGSLAQYCGKKKCQSPQYLAEMKNGTLVGTVWFCGTYIKCEQTSSSIKEANVRAAYEALKHLGYLKGKPFEMPHNLLKRKKDEGDMETDTKERKLGDPVHITARMHLHAICNSKKFPTPTYHSVTVPGGFFSTVTIGDKQFKSMNICAKRKDADQSAAQTALDALGPIAVPHILVPNPVPPLDVKGCLNRYCQKNSKGTPVYEVKYSEDDKMYDATVTVDGVTYYGPPEKLKKVAERAAAVQAMMALGQVV